MINLPTLRGSFHYFDNASIRISGLGYAAMAMNRMRRVVGLFSYIRWSSPVQIERKNSKTPYTPTGYMPRGGQTKEHREEGKREFLFDRHVSQGDPGVIGRPASFAPLFRYNALLLFPPRNAVGVERPDIKRIISRFFSPGRLVAYVPNAVRALTGQSPQTSGLYKVSLVSRRPMIRLLVSGGAGGPLGLKFPRRVDVDAETLEFFKSNQFASLVMIFVKAALNLVPNRRSGNVLVRVGAYHTGEIAAGNVQSAGHNLQPNFWSTAILIRLSHSPEVLIFSCLVAAIEFYLDYQSRFVESNSGDILIEELEGDEEIDQHVLTLRYLLFQAVIRGPLSMASIRNGSQKTLDRVTSNYSNHQNNLLRVGFQRFYSFLDEEKLKVISPETVDHCIFKALLIQRRPQWRPYPKLDRRTKKTMNQRVSELAKKIKQGNKSMKAGEIFTRLATLFWRARFSVYAFTGELIWDENDPEVHIRRMRGSQGAVWNDEFHFRFVVAQGHCFALVPKTEEECLMLGPPIKGLVPFDGDDTEIVGMLIDEFLEKDKQDKRSLRMDVVLDGIKDQVQDYNIIVFDLETTADTIAPYACGWSIWTGLKPSPVSFEWGEDCVKNFIHTIYTSARHFTKQKHLVFAHYGGGFDFHFIINQIIDMPEFDYKVKNSIEINGSLVRFDLYLRYTNTKLQFMVFTFRDSLPMFAGLPLRTLLESFDCKIQKGDIPHDQITSETWPEYQEDCTPYLNDDVAGLMELLLAYRKNGMTDYEVDPIKCLTASSFSRDVFFHKYYDLANFPIYRVSNDLDKIIRLAYYGGRVECGLIGHRKMKIYYYDFTSLYPSVMIVDLPYGVPVHFSENLYEVIANERLAGIARCKVRGQSSNGINILPVRSDNGLIFPNFENEVEGHWSTHEIKLAMEMGYQIELLELWMWTTAAYFKDMVNRLFTEKKQAKAEENGGMAFLSKVILNSLYGYWAIRYADVKKLVLETAKKTDAEPWTKYVETGSLIRCAKRGKISFMRVREHLEPKYVCSIIAATVTALARIKLWRLLSDIKEVRGTVFYMDTDSIITDFNIEEDEVLCEKWMGEGMGGNLGELKAEFGLGRYADKLVVAAPKCYAFKGDIPEEFHKPKFKGFYKRKNWSKTFRTKSEYNFGKPIGNSRNRPLKEKSVPIITLTSGEGNQHLEYSDLKKMTQGGIIEMNTWTFNGKVGAWINEGRVVRTDVKIKFRTNYKKGIVGEDGLTSPLTI